MFRHFEKIRTLTPVLALKKISTKIQVETLREYSIIVQKCKAILNNVLLSLLTNSLSFGIV